MLSLTFLINQLFFIPPDIPKDPKILQAVELLAKCESNLNQNAINRNDGAGGPSIGLLQFKLGTFKYFTTKYGLLDSERLEYEDWINWMYNGEFQRELTYEILKDDVSNLSHWRNCARKHKLATMLNSDTSVPN